MTVTVTDSLAQTILRCTRRALRLPFNSRAFGVMPILFWAATALNAAPVDTSHLPPPLPLQVEFERDIRPILTLHCLHCHNAERPKGNFRLDRRELALKGGDNGTNIFPGQSGRSPLIFYVAGLVADMEMPPLGKDDPLTAREVGLLRAWIDQGATWGSVPITEQVPAPPTRHGGSGTGPKRKAASAPSELAASVGSAKQSLGSEGNLR